MPNQLRKIILSFVLAGLIGFYFVSPASVDKADAFLGIADVGFQTTIGDIPRYLFQIGETIAKAGLRKLKKRMLTQIQNDLVNWVQNGGEPRFIKHPLKFLENAGKDTVARTIDDVFSSNKIDICSPFKASVQFLVTKPTLLREESLRCSFSDMKENIEKFANNFEDGGWTTWLKLHETRNTLPGSYLGVSQLVNEKRSQGQTVAAAKISATGFLDQKKCSKAKFQKYNLEYEEVDGTVYEDDLSQEDLAEVADFNIDLLSGDYNYDWNAIWSVIGATTPIDRIKTGTIHLVPTGEFFPPIPLGPPPRDTPPGAICVEEEVITPGSVVGDWVSGGLKDLSLGPLMNAKELGDIVNAVIDAAVNRVAREGLSKLASGPGSWTQPSKASGATYYGQAAVQPAVIGAESPTSSALLNRVLTFQNNIQKLITQINSLIRSEATADKFKQALGNMNFLLRKHNDVDDIIDSNYANQKFKFNEESRNPGPYIANKILNEVIAAKWDSVVQTLQNIDVQLPDSCTSPITYIRFFEHPQKEAMPFTDKEGKVFKKTEVQNIYWYLLTPRKPGEDGDGAVETTATAWKNEYLTIARTRASSNKNLYLNTANSYRGLIDNAKQLLATFQNDETGDADDSEFINSILPNVSQYDSLLTDYDTAAREAGALGALQNYLELKDQAADEVELKVLRETVLQAQRTARNRWQIIQQDIADPVKTIQIPPDEKNKAAKKVGIIKDAIARVELSLRNLLASQPEELEFFGLTPANVNALSLDRVLDLIAQIPSLDFVQDAQNVGAATAEAINQAEIALGPGHEQGFNISRIESDLSEREGKVNTRQSEITDTVGLFLDKENEDEARVDNIVEERKKLGVKSGDSEWEKYYYNRFQLAYATYISDFYKNWFKCPLPNKNPDQFTPSD